MKTKTRKRRIISTILAITILASLCMSTASAREDGDWYEVEIPNGYTYYESVKHNIGWQVESISWGVSTVAGIVISAAAGPLAGTFLSIGASEVGSWIADFIVGDHIDGYYYDYIYECEDPGIYPYIYFHHYVYFVEDGYGDAHYVAQDTAYEFALLPR